jgi:hypothetical protein
MSRLITAGALSVTVCLIAGLAYVSDSASSNAQAAPKDAPASPEVREIELSTIYSTSGQKKLINVQEHLDDRGPEWNEPHFIGNY